MKSCSRGPPRETQATYPAWWMWMPLLVGLAGADCVSEDVVRMRWGRAFTVACKSKGTSDMHGQLLVTSEAAGSSRNAGFMTREEASWPRRWCTPMGRPCR